MATAHRDHGHGMRYQRILQLGSGGMAIVYLSLAVGQSGFKRLVVVKSIREELLTNPDMRQMFLAEARLSARLNHPNVVQVSEVVDSPEGVMLVMEYLDGLSFAAAYRAVGEALTLPMRIRVLCEVLAGLHYAHELTDYHGRPLGIVHRDVSPQNVFITYDGRVKLLDFGIAKATAAPDLTRAGVIKGRIAYMPIEQLKGERVDRRTDVYAVGCLLWEAIAGSRMWDKMPEAQIARHVFEGKIPPLSSRVQVDPELDRIVSRATAHLPSQRYASAEEMRLDLERYLKSSPITLRDIGALLSTACQEAREQRQELIAHAIARVERDFPSLHDDVQPTDSATWSSGTRTGTPSTTLASAVPVRHGSGPRPKVSLPSPEDALGPASTTHSRSATLARRRNRMWISVGLIAIAGTVAALVHTRTRVENPAPAAQTPLPAAELKPYLRVETTPSSARVLVDGVVVEGTPAAIRVAPNTEHTIRVEAPGYTPEERRVVVDVDTSLRIDLEEEQPPAPSASASASKKTHGRGAVVAPVAPVAPSRPTTAPPSATGSKSNCDPPYYFAGGIKTYKPECL